MHTMEHEEVKGRYPMILDEKRATTTNPILSCDSSGADCTRSNKRYDGLALAILPICRRGKINRKHILIMVLLQYQIMDGIMTSAAYPSPKEGKILSIIEYIYTMLYRWIRNTGIDATGHICLGVSQLGICKTTYSVRDKKVALISYQTQRRSAITTGFIFKWMCSWW